MSRWSVRGFPPMRPRAFVYRPKPELAEVAARNSEEAVAFTSAERARWRSEHPVQALLDDLADARWRKVYAAQVAQAEACAARWREGR